MLAVLAGLLFLQTPPAAQPAAKGDGEKKLGARIANVGDVRKRLGLSPSYDSVSGLENVRIAVLDYGFEGYDPERGQLPAGTTVVEHYPADFVTRNGLGDPEMKRPFPVGNTHGRVMAQIVWATTNFNPNGPKFYLLNANGPTMFRRAVRYALENGVQVILFSGSFEGIGNFDGKGPLNAVVDDAVRAGVVWVNAAGNFGAHTYDGPVKIGADGYLTFANGLNYLRFRNHLDENQVSVTLNWNSYTDTEDAGCEKDLDLYVEDGNGKVLGSSELTQIPVTGESGQGKSKNPREKVTLVDPRGSSDKFYRIRIKAKTQNFGETDRLRVLVTAVKEAPYLDPVTKLDTYPIVFVDATYAGEVFPPADNPRVVTVGDAGMGSSIGPTGDRRVKPDFVLEDSEAVFTSGDSSLGSSNAAAYFAGVAVVLKAKYPGLRTPHLLALTSHLANKTGTSTSAKPTGATTAKSKTGGAPGTAIGAKKAKTMTAGAAVGEIEKLCPTLLVWQATDKRLIAGVDRSPHKFTKLFPNFPTDKMGRLVDDFEFYVAMPKNVQNAKPFGYFRRKNGSDPVPWTAQGGKAEDWVEVRQHPPGGSTTASRMLAALAKRVWKTPSPSDLDRLFPASARTPFAVAPLDRTPTNSSAGEPAAAPTTGDRTPPPPPTKSG